MNHVLYDTVGNVTYKGTAVLSAATSDESWIIERTTLVSEIDGIKTTIVCNPLDENGDPITTASLKWDDRKTLRYNTADDVTPPTLSSAVRVSNTILTVTASEFLQAETVTKSNAGGFLVKETGAPGTAYAVSKIEPGTTADKIKLTVADMTASKTAGVTVTYVSGGNGTITDQSANAMATDATGVVVAAW